VKKHTLHSLGILITALGAGAYSCSSPLDTGGLGGLGASGSGATGGTAAKGNTGGASGSSASSSGGTIAAGGSTSGGSANSDSGGSTHVDVDASMMTGGTTTMVDPDAACGMSTASATLKTVNMFVMFDRSWSMTECGASGATDMFAGGDPRCTTGPSRWALTSAALIQFIQSPMAANLRMALRFFPDDHPVVGCDGYPTTTTGGTMMGGTMGGFFGGGAGTTGGTGTAGRGNTGGAGRGGVGAAGSPAGTAGAGDNCDANACAQPLVDIGALTADPAPMDVQEGLLVAAINNSAPPDVATLNPNPQTPTSAALQGAATWATTYETAHPDEKTVIILITDGEPAGCDTSATNISNIAANAFMTGGIQTYVIGLGGLNSAALNQIAAAGGTMTAFTVSATSDSTTELFGQLTAIQGQALKCQLDVPKSDQAGKTVDPNFITVAYSSGTNASTSLGIVSSMDQCGTDQDWYFDNPTAPTQIILCPSACDAITADKDATIAISVGCTEHTVTR
jgi:uncharacterized protein YegL